MSYRALYHYAQQTDPPLRSNELKAKVCELVGATSVRTVVSGMDTAICRGMYLSPRNKEHQLARQFGGHIIVAARSLSHNWPRFIVFKELIHMLDQPVQATDSGERFDEVLEELTGTIPLDRSAATQAELAATWKALSLFCPEHERLTLGEARERGHTTDYAISLKLKMPELHVPKLFSRLYREMYDRHISQEQP